MELCEHLVPYYKQEIAAGNTVMSVCVKGWSAVDYIVFFNYAFKYNYKYINNESPYVTYGISTRTPHNPESQGLVCKKCRKCLSSPWTDTQEIKGFYLRSQIPNPDVIATNENVFAPDDLSGDTKPTVIE